MSVDADYLVDRRRIRRKLTFWRVTAFVILVIALIAGLLAVSDYGNLSKRSAHIARLPVNGVILDNRDQLKLIEKIGQSASVKGVIISINSPGGSTTGGETLYNAIRELSKKKPVVAEIRTVGASAGYMIALAADHIVARYNSITGSIGVLFQFGNAAKLMETLGLEMDAVKSAPLKAEPDFYSPASEEAKGVLKDLVMDSFDWFVALVAERRNLPPGEARRLADGRIYSGHAANQNGLIDEIGGEDAAIAWLTEKKGVEADLPVLDWTLADDQNNLPLSVKMSQAIGFGIANGLFEQVGEAKRLISPALTLDGLVSVWQAPGAEQEKSLRRGGGQ
ncbi:signal peptide peptidase SppA [Roseibium litorale]|uniref:Signal peptide peptidase SppA n=1 Tax=Roseibium litorale TaxID=2803841 RepID=A0ABR9CLN1_9HYPH|nr:signal peptide peptidase SppA [Roseibium litorale]MBD8891758.1 signal peptide peptidase SppA [Roseibium litorale]